MAAMKPFFQKGQGAEKGDETQHAISINFLSHCFTNSLQEQVATVALALAVTSWRAACRSTILWKEKFLLKGQVQLSDSCCWV